MTYDSRTKALAIGLGFLACIYLANYATDRWGMVGLFGVTFTAGTYAAGLSFGLRDALHEVVGWRPVMTAILIGSGLSAFLNPRLALASGVAFLLSETADLAIYAPLRRKAWVRAVIASNLIGALVDTIIFLWIANFPIVDAVGGQMVGKGLMILPALFVIKWVRRK